MECNLNGFQSIRYVNGYFDILYSYDVSFAVQYTCTSQPLKQTLLYVRYTNTSTLYVSPHASPLSTCLWVHLVGKQFATATSLIISTTRETDLHVHVRYITHWVSRENFTRMRFQPATPELMCQHSTNELSNLYVGTWKSPYFVDTCTVSLLRSASHKSINSIILNHLWRSIFFN